MECLSMEDLTALYGNSLVILLLYLYEHSGQVGYIRTSTAKAMKIKEYLKSTKKELRE